MPMNWYAYEFFLHAAVVRQRPSLEFDERLARHHITNYYKQNKWKPGMATCMHIHM